MGRASTYFYDANDGERQTLHRRIRPSDTQFTAQQDRWNSLLEYLVPRLREASGYRIRSWLQGSYKFGTQIRPVTKGLEFDIDLGVYYLWPGSSQIGRHNASELKEFVQDGLKDFAIENADVRLVAEPPKERCCRIHFDGDFHIDVPAYHLDEGEDLRELATESNRWESSDPKALYLWFTDEFDDYRRDRVRRLIRYMKAWAALKFRDGDKLPSSVLLTILVANSVSDMGRDVPGPDDEAFRQVVNNVLATISGQQDVRNPVDDQENLAARMNEEAWAAFVDEMQTLDGIAEAAVQCDNDAAACTQWSLAFEHLFPLPEAIDLEEAARSLPTLITLPEVSVQAYARNNPNVRYTGRNEIGPIPKNCEITFRVINANHMPHGTQYYWMVRNEGVEAEDVNDLGHRAGTTLTASERSAYNGVHYMDCTAVAAGRVVGIRRVKVDVRGVPVPPRNRKKPGYVALRGRR